MRIEGEHSEPLLVVGVSAPHDVVNDTPLADSALFQPLNASADERYQLRLR
jgi:hypothetical protein